MIGEQQEVGWKTIVGGMEELINRVDEVRVKCCKGVDDGG